MQIGIASQVEQQSCQATKKGHIFWLEKVVVEVAVGRGWAGLYVLVRNKFGVASGSFVLGWVPLPRITSKSVIFNAHQRGCSYKL